MASPKLKIWADEVKQRDGKCVECGSPHDLHAHHIQPKATNPELMLDVTNGKTLCYRCHKAEHEKNRQPRMRACRPQRRTLEARIKFLEKELTNKELAEYRLRKRVRDCDRGVCFAALAAIRKYKVAA